MRKKILIFLCVLFIPVFAAACASSGDSESGGAASAEGPLDEDGSRSAGSGTASQTQTSGREEAVKEQFPKTEHIRDNDALYSDSDQTSVVTMYLTVTSGNSTDVTDHTWTEINKRSVYYYEELGIDRYNAECILQVGDENGPVQGEVGYGETLPNASVRIKGQSSSTAEQKSYKIRLKKGKGSWNGQRTIALSKCQFDFTRFADKMNFDLLTEIPQLLSIRTRFVHLYVKDLTADPADEEFVDYGLYTQTEQMNKTYLEAHGLDPNGQLYKVNAFSFYEYSQGVIVPETDAAYDRNTFEEYLEIKGSSDHTKFVEMMNAVTNEVIPITDTVDKYFDLENLVYYQAFNILIGNNDTGTRNQFYYSPLNSDKWYILLWDLDQSWYRNYYREIENGYVEGEGWEYGISLYANNALFLRMMQEEKYRDALTAAVEDLYHNYFQEDQVRERTRKYSSVVKPFVFSEPDVLNVKTTEADYDRLINMLPSEPAENYARYYESLKKPVPVYLFAPELNEDGTYGFSWGASCDFNGEELSYDLIIATDLSFDEDSIVYRKEGMKIPGCRVEHLDPGEYYGRLIIRNASGYEQYCLDYITTLDGKVYGCVQFSINSDGTVTVEEE